MDTLSQQIAGVLLDAEGKNMPVEYLPSQSWWPANHPHAAKSHNCAKCGSPRVSLPAYNGDYFDCLECGHSWPQTEKQTAFMRRNPASRYSETVVTNDRTLNYVLQKAGDLISRRDLAPLDKINTLYAYLLKARRELLGEVE